MSKILKSLKEYEIEILVFWFGFHFNKNFEHNQILDFWKNRWFVKGDLQHNFDSQIKKKFEKYFDSEFFPNYNNHYSMIAHLILYDQFSRNCFRGTTQAYDYDKKSQQILLHILNNYTIEAIFRMNIQEIVLLMLCMAHTENIETHKTLKKFLSIFVDKFERKYYTLCKTFSQLIENHTLRIEMFGRIPERNIILQRTSTEKEKAFIGVL
jgi:uncharacterized protein (DUF924 family)